MIGGYDEYKKRFIKEIEVITAATDQKGQQVKVSSGELPELKVGRISPSSIILENRYLYVLFGKAKKGRGEVFQQDIEQLDLCRVTQFRLIRLSHSSLSPVSFSNSLAFDQSNPNEILLVGGIQTLKDPLPCCYKLVMNHTRNEFYIEKVKMVSGSQ